MATIRIAIIVTVTIVAAMINCAVLTMHDVQSTSGENETQQSTSGENETQQSTGQQLQLGDQLKIILRPKRRIIHLYKSHFNNYSSNSNSSNNNH